MDKEALIKKWLDNSLTEQEQLAFSKLEDAKQNVALVDTAKAFKASGISEVEDFESFKKNYETRLTSKSNWWFPILKIAGVLVVMLGLYFMVFNNTQTEFETLIGEKTSIILPDESEVQLNAMSQVSFNETDWAENRVINLEGEAYFKVAKGKTFDVLTSEGVVTVVGTEFNVKQRDDYFEVHCFEGVVKVTAFNESKILKASETFLNVNGKTSASTKLDSEPDWLVNMSSFDRIPYAQIIKELERQYNINVNLEGVDTKRLFTGGFPHNNLDDAIIAITKPMGLSYSKSASNQVLIYGKNQ